MLGSINLNIEKVVFEKKYGIVGFFFLFKQKQNKAKQNKKPNPVREWDFLPALAYHSSHLRYVWE